MGNTMEISALVEGGKASGGPPIGPSLGPTGVPIKAVVDMINKKTEAFKGLKVPVKITVDLVEKTFEVTISTPMASALMFKELGIEKGSGKAGTEFAADITMDQIITVTKMKRDALNALTLKNAVKIILGTAVAAGLKVDGKTAKQVTQEVTEGKYDEQLKE